MSRWTFLLALALLCSQSDRMDAQEKLKPARRPNILWIVAENIDLDLGCYGAKHVKTPNLDRLAREGVRFTRVFATAPVCAPSRSAFMTGMYQTTTDTHHMRSHRDDQFRLPPGVRPLTHWLQDAGYSTFNIGMILRWLVGTVKLDLNFVNEGKIFQSDKWADLKNKQPFFAMINTPEVEYDIYDRKTSKKSRVEWVGEKEHPQIAKPDEVTPPAYFPDHPVAREEWARYLNSVSGLDLRVGKILDALKTDGLEDDTIVIFFADNGRLDVRGIHWCYDSGLRVPMIIRWPRNFPAPANCSAGSVNEQVISLLDLTATTMDVAGLKRPPLMQSRVFLGPNADPPRQYAFSARDRIDETVNRIRSVRDERYRYNRNFMPEQSLAALNRYREKCFLVMPLARQLHAEGKLKGPALSLVAPRLPDEELFDTKTDPFEIQNLADSKAPEHREALLRLRTALEVWIAETGDRGRFPEPPEVVAPFEKEMHDWFGTPAWYKKPAPAPNKKPDPRQEFLEAEKAGPDFAVQGEYEGEIAAQGKFGAQVIAHGEGNFALVFLPGGLPTEKGGWDGKSRIKVLAKTLAGKTTFKDSTNKNAPDFGWTGEFGNETLTGKTREGHPFSLKRVVRQSPTLAAKPPAGAVVLFDGSSAAEWEGGKLVDGFLSHIDNKWATSKKVFRDYQAHVEFRAPFMPFARGQGRANSGVYLDQRNKNSRPGYEIQVLDSFGLDGKIDECGAVYGQKAPLLNMCFPPLSWQTYDIQIKAARWNKNGTKAASPVLTVHHNGVKIHDNLELQENYLTGGEKSLADKPGALMLQNYVGKVYYRNIWVVEKFGTSP